MNINQIIEESINSVIGATPIYESDYDQENIEEGAVADAAREHLKNIDGPKSATLAAAIAAGVGGLALAKKMRKSGQSKLVQGSNNLIGLAPKLNAGEKAVENVYSAVGRGKNAVKEGVASVKQKAQHAKKTAELNYLFAKQSVKDKANSALDKAHGGLKSKLA